MEKIDAVITWVDGDDPALRTKRLQYGDQNVFSVEDLAGETRYKSVGEIFWCVASINRFAPWINKIWIVTDNQNPCIDSLLEMNFPEGYIPYEIVDHKVIFRGYEQCLPCFNSISIETLTWRIPGLSDKYIEFNDDMVLTALTLPEDFFTADGSPVAYCKVYNMLWEKLKMKFGKKHDLFRTNMFNASLLAGNRFRYLKYDHTPRALRRDWFESYFSANEDMLMKNITHRFRDFSQYSAELLQYSILAKEGRCVLKSFREHMIYFRPKNRQGYADRKLRKLDSGKYRFCCFNSVEEATEEDFGKITSWLKKRLKIDF